jgi:hypothetical protein
MEDYRDLLHIRFAERVIGWTDVEMVRADGGLKFYGQIQTSRGPQRRAVPDYSNDLDAMWAAEQYLHSLGLTAPYLRALAALAGAHDLNEPADLFRLVCASPAQRCEAALRAYDEAQPSEPNTV